MAFTVLAVGDVVSASGLRLLSARLRRVIRATGADFTVVNGENAAGLGLTPRQAEDMLDAGADVITLGNHSFHKMEICDYLDDCGRILRPANLAPQNPGRGWGLFDTRCGPALVLNLIGRCGMDFGPDNPFLEADRILKAHPARFTLVDFHAEATSEKLAMGWHLNGRASAVWGTHTHVQTSDGGVLPGGTGYITDLGMTGPRDSVLGIRPEQSVSMFLGNPKGRFEAAAGPAKLECAVFTLNEDTGRCEQVTALRVEE